MNSTIYFCHRNKNLKQAKAFKKKKKQSKHVKKRGGLFFKTKCIFLDQKIGGNIVLAIQTYFFAFCRTAYMFSQNSQRKSILMHRH